MMPIMVKEADLDRIEVPEDYEILDATALGRRLGFKRDTVLAYLSRRNFRRMHVSTFDLSGPTAEQQGRIANGEDSPKVLGGAASSSVFPRDVVL